MWTRNAGTTSISSTPAPMYRHRRRRRSWLRTSKGGANDQTQRLRPVIRGDMHHFTFGCAEDVETSGQHVETQDGSCIHGISRLLLSKAERNIGRTDGGRTDTPYSSGRRDGTPPYSSRRTDGHTPLFVPLNGRTHPLIHTSGRTDTPPYTSRRTDGHTPLFIRSVVT